MCVMCVFQNLFKCRVETAAYTHLDNDPRDSARSNWRETHTHTYIAMMCVCVVHIIMTRSSGLLQLYLFSSVWMLGVYQMSTFKKSVGRVWQKSRGGGLSPGKFKWKDLYTQQIITEGGRIKSVSGCINSLGGMEEATPAHTSLSYL